MQELNQNKHKYKEYHKEMLLNEQKRIESEKQRKKLKEEEKENQIDFSGRVEGNIIENKKIIGFIKRYVLIGIISGVPGIALTYLWDKWQENQMVKELYQKNIETVSNQDNRELAREYELLRKKFNKAYDIDKIANAIKTSQEIEKIKNNSKAIKIISEEIKKYRQLYEENLNKYIEYQIKTESEEKIETESEMDEMEEEYILKTNKISIN